MTWDGERVQQRSGGWKWKHYEEKGVQSRQEPGNCGGGASGSPFAQFDRQCRNKGLKAHEWPRAVSCKVTHDAVRPWPFQSEMLTHTPTGLGSFPYADGQVENWRGHVFPTFPSHCWPKVRFCFLQRRRGRGIPPNFHMVIFFFFTNYKSKIFKYYGAPFWWV